MLLSFAELKFQADPIAYTQNITEKKLQTNRNTHANYKTIKIRKEQTQINFTIQQSPLKTGRLSPVGLILVGVGI